MLGNYHFFFYLLRLCSIGLAGFMSSVLQLIDERQESQRISPLLTAPDLSYSGCIGAIGVEGLGFGVEGFGVRVI